MIWTIFLILVVLLLALDLGVLNRNAHVISTREAAKWTTLWVSLALSFTAFVYFGYEQHWLGLGETVGHNLSGGEAAMLYLTGYLIEQSLSIDNIFVIAVIFAYFKVPPQYQHRVLFWGILGAVVFRGIMIVAGAFLIERFAWIMYIFGAFLIYSAWKMATADDEEIEPDKNPVTRLVRKFYPVIPRFDGEKFFIRRMGITAATPLFIALIVIETTDVMFALDSIPAIFAITTDTFIVFTSNIFAILGLRSMYFFLANMLEKFRYLKYSVFAILIFVGIKLITHHFIVLPEWFSLTFVIASLALGVAVSIMKNPKKKL